MATANLADSAHIAVRWNNRPAGHSPDRFDDKRQYILRPKMLDPLFKRRRAGSEMIFQGLVRRSAIWQWRRYRVRCDRKALEERRARLIAANCRRGNGRAMIGRFKGDYRAPRWLAHGNGILTRELKRSIHRFAATGSKRHPLESRTSERSETGREVSVWAIAGDVGNGVVEKMSLS